MTVTRRAWRGWEDLAPMQSLASARLRAGDSLMHPGDVAWALGWFPKTQEQRAASVSLWHRGHELVGWSLLDRGELWTCTAPNDTEADDAIEAAAAEMPGPLSRVARDDDVDALARLRASGYARAPDEDMRVFVRLLDDVDVAAVDERVRPVDPDDDLAPRLRVTHAAFEVAMSFDAYVEAYAAEIPGPLSRVARDDDDQPVARLGASGYERVPDEDMRVFVRSLDDVDVEAIDERVRSVDAADDVVPRLRVTHAAFEVAMPFDAYSEAYASFMQTPAYPRGWDLVAWTDDGAPAAATIAWPDGDSLVGNFEPVAAHPAHRRRGFASVVMREGMRRLRAAGMTRAIVRTPVSNTGATALYRSVGFADVGLELVLRRP